MAFQYDPEPVGTGQKRPAGKMHEWEIVDNKSPWEVVDNPSNATRRMRVPGGWIYLIAGYRDSQTVFVPWPQFEPGRHGGTEGGA